MLQNKFEMPLDLAVKDSKIFHNYILIIFSLSIVSVFISSLSLILQVSLVLLLIVMILTILKKQRINKITNLKLSGDDKWEIEINNTQIYNAELQGECIVMYFLVWLNFTTCSSDEKKKTLHIMLLPDSIDKDLFRKFRARLRFLKNTTAENKVQGNGNISHP